MSLFVTLSITDTEHNTQHNSTEWHYAECRVKFIVMLNVIMLNVVKLNVMTPYDDRNKLGLYHPE
jgi:hypothetical protein